MLRVCQGLVRDPGKNFIKLSGGDPRFLCENKSGYAASATSILMISDVRDWIVRCRSACWASCYLPDRLFEPVERFSLVRTLADCPRELDAPCGKTAAVVGIEDDSVLHDLYCFTGGYTAFLVGKVCPDFPNRCGPDRTRGEGGGPHPLPLYFLKRGSPPTHVPGRWGVPLPVARTGPLPCRKNVHSRTPPVGCSIRTGLCFPYRTSRHSISGGGGCPLPPSLFFPRVGGSSDLLF